MRLLSKIANNHPTTTAERRSNRSMVSFRRMWQTEDHVGELCCETYSFATSQRFFVWLARVFQRSAINQLQKFHRIRAVQTQTSRYFQPSARMHAKQHLLLRQLFTRRLFQNQSWRVQISCFAFSSVKNPKISATNPHIWGAVINKGLSILLVHLLQWLIVSN